MDRLGLCILVSLTTILVQANSDRIVSDTLESVDSVSGFGLEMILSKHDNLEHKFDQLREDVEEQRKSNARNQEKLTQTLELLAKMQQEMQQSNTEFQQAITEIQQKQEQNYRSLDSITQTLSELKSTLSTLGLEAKKNQNETGSMQQLERDHKQMRNTLLDIQLGSYRSCNDVPWKVSGKYKIRANVNLHSFEAYCEQSGGDWMVIQWRYDGKQNFNRNWTDYRDGFGEVDREHWLGLERIHQFTKEHECELIIQLHDFEGTYKSARYDSFAIGSEAEGYYLKTLGTYTGTAGDSLRNHKGMKFSTPDRDNNDTKLDGNCAVNCESGWWFNNCGYAFLNGLHRNVKGPNKNNIAWYGFNDDWRGLRNSRMLIRPK